MQFRKEIIALSLKLHKYTTRQKHILQKNEDVKISNCRCKQCYKNFSKESDVIAARKNTKQDVVCNKSFIIIKVCTTF